MPPMALKYTLDPKANFKDRGQIQEQASTAEVHPP